MWPSKALRLTRRLFVRLGVFPSRRVYCVQSRLLIPAGNWASELGRCDETSIRGNHTIAINRVGRWERVLAVSLVAVFGYGLVEGRALALVSVTYIAVGLWSFRLPARRGWFPLWVIPSGVALAGLEFTNICLEQFIGLPSPANAVVPASMMALLVLAASTAAIVASAGDSLFRGIVFAVLVVGLGMLLSVSAVLLFVAIRAASQPNEVALLELTCENATMHLTLPLLIAAIVGSVAAAVSASASRYQLRTSAFISLAGIAIFTVGVRILVLAASLPRVERAPLVMPGMALCTLGLVFLPCILGRRAQTGTA